MTVGQAEPITRSDDVSVAELLDRLLAGGLVVEGDLILSVADVDLVWLGLRAVAGSVSHAPPHVRCSDSSRPRTRARPPVAATDNRSTPGIGGHRGERAVRPAPSRVGFDGERVERGLVRLVMSVVELVRDLMERQAVRRLDDECLSEEQVEQLGLTMMRLAERMEDLKSYFGLDGEDLQLPLVGDSSGLIRRDEPADTGTVPWKEHT